MEILAYLLIGVVSFILGVLCGAKLMYRKKAGILRLIKDDIDDVYYLHADLNIEPFDLVNEGQVMFDVEYPPVAQSNIAKLTK